MPQEPAPLVAYYTHPRRRWERKGFDLVHLDSDGPVGAPTRLPVDPDAECDGAEVARDPRLARYESMHKHARLTGVAMRHAHRISALSIWRINDRPHIRVGGTNGEQHPAYQYGRDSQGGYGEKSQLHRLNAE